MSRFYKELSKRSKLYGHFKEAISMYEGGKTLKEVANIYGMNDGSLCELFKSRGIKTRSVSEACRLAYEKGRRRPHRLMGASNPSWKGGRTRRSDGYILILHPDHPRADERNYVYEHIVIAEKKIGRLLTDNEVVHHINGAKNDNRPKNLQVVKDVDHRCFHAELRHKNQKGGGLIEDRC